VLIMKMKRFSSLRSKITIFCLIITIVPLLVVSSFSYLESTNIVLSQVRDLNLINAKQISNNIEFMMNDIDTISLNLIQNKELSAYLLSQNPDYQQNQQLQILSLLNDQKFNKKYIYSIYIAGKSSQLDNMGAINTVPAEKLDQVKQLNGKASWYLNSIQIGNQQVNVISMIREIRDVNNISRLLGIIKINILESSLRDLYSSKLKIDNSLFYIISQDNVILSSLNFNQLGSRLDQTLSSPSLSNQTEGHYKARIGDRQFLAIYYKMEKWDWKIVELTPYEMISKPGEAIKKVTVYSIMASLVICLGFILFFVSRVLKPLKQIRVLMRHLGDENFDIEMKVQGNDEITLLALSFNQMSRKLDELVNEVHVSKIKQKEAELKALEEQINPHFLYNTLDVIYWMSRMEKAFETSVMVNALSKLFRLGLNNGSGFTTVGREVDHLQSYILIQQKRYEETIVFTLEVSPETLDCKVTKMILQPIVENAISHGIEQKDGSGRIHVWIYKEDECLVYNISDDGAGADENTIRELIGQVKEDNKGLGLTNINDRIKLNFGEQYGVEFRSERTKGTTVLVRQPFLQGGA
jgi:two-component system sensor histidine kinase YesM